MCVAKSDNTGQISTACVECSYGYVLLVTGSCYACGSSKETLGCKVCTPQLTCQTCQPGLSLNSTHQCVAETVDESSNNGMYIVLISIMSTVIVGLAVLIGYNMYK